MRCDRSETMRRIHSRNSSLEILFRKELWRVGLRYRLNSNVLGKPDIVFNSKRLAIFIDSCFWHGCSMHCRMPHSNIEYWHRKIDGNRMRDSYVTSALAGSGWKVLRFWEHELKANMPGCVGSVRSAVLESRVAARRTHQHFVI